MIEYIIKVSYLAKQVGYDEKVIIDNIDYFETKFKENLSPYKAVEFLYFHLNK